MFFILILEHDSRFFSMINAISTKRNTLLQLIQIASRQSKESVTRTRERNKPQASLTRRID